MVEEHRARLNLMQEEPANEVGVGIETKVFLEKEKYNSSLRLAYGIAAALGVKIDDLFIFDDKPRAEGD